MLHYLPRRFFPWLLMFLLGFAGMVQPAVAADAPATPAPAPERVLSVGVTGNRFIETETVLAEVKTKAGDLLDRKQIGRDVRTLFDTGYFSNVSVEGIRSPKGVRVIFHVVENPVIGEVKLKGNSAIETKIFKFKLKMQPGRVLNETLKRHDIETIRHMYLKKGYYQIGIHIKTKKRSDGRVDVVIGPWCARSARPYAASTSTLPSRSSRTTPEKPDSAATASIRVRASSIPSR